MWPKNRSVCDVCGSESKHNEASFLIISMDLLCLQMTRPGDFYADK
jgi:hypothetical protein